MKTEQQRIAIAEFCGWKVEETDWRTFGLFRPNEQRCASEHDTTLMAWANVPDYPNDLNAMHEAEKKLKPSRLGVCEIDSLWPEYVIQLSDLSRENMGSNIHASALQRAEAFLKTIGKWKD